MRIVYDSCPVCHSAKIGFVLTAVDQTVSKEKFEIWECDSCSHRFTQSIPSMPEIGKYYKSEDYISHSESNKGLINRLYHNIRKITLRSKRNLVERSTGRSGGAILDLGAGTGAFLHTMKDAGWKVNGLEPDTQARENAKNKYGVELEELDQFMSWPSQSCDAVTMWHVLEHVHELHPYLDKLREILKPGGRIFIAVPNYTSYDAKVYGEAWAAYDVPRHLYHFSPRSMGQLLKAHDLELEKIKPMWFDSFYVSMLSEGYKYGSSNIFKAIWNGFVSNLKTLVNKDRCSSLIYIIRKPEFS